MARNKHPEETVKRIVDISLRLFTEKGFDKTSLQDILNATGLSKGAIYHHFASKADIFDAIGQQIGQENIQRLSKIRDNLAMSVREKLKALFLASVCVPQQNVLLSVVPNMLQNPEFLAMQVQEVYDIVAPHFLKPILEQGQKDGTLQVEDPAYLAEAIVVLANIWLNPLAQPGPSTPEAMRARCRVFNRLLSGYGYENFIDTEMAEAYVRFCLALQPAVK